MSQTSTPIALLCMPNGDARNAMHAALAALHVESQDIMPSKTELANLAQILHANPQAVAIIDLAQIRHAAANILALAALLPDAKVRQKIVLTRTHRSVWPSDRAWAKELGFADFFAELDAGSLLAESNAVLDWVALRAGIAPIDIESLKQHFDTLHVKPDTASERGVIRKATALSAEAFCASLASHVDTQDRTHNLTTYQSCFFGSAAVNWISKKYAITKDRAVSLGVALQELGLLHHVAHEQVFGDAPFFYRTEWSEISQSLSPGSIFSLISAKSGVLVQDRSYHGTNYPACFVGAYAVDWLHSKLQISRLDAEIMLNRLYGFDLIEHVTHEHPVLDGMYFYRFTG